MNNLDWASLIGISLFGLVPLCIAYWIFFRTKDKSSRPKVSSNKPIATPSTQSHSASPAFEEAYRQKMEEIKKRRQLREQNRRLAIEKIRQAALVPAVPKRTTSTIKTDEIIDVGSIIGLNKPDPLIKPPSPRDKDKDKRPHHKVTRLKPPPAASKPVQPERRQPEALQPAAQPLKVESAKIHTASPTTEPSLGESLPSPNKPSARAVSLAADSLTTDVAKMSRPALLNNAYAGYFVSCDSKAQRLLLKALIQKAKLKPDGNALSGLIRVEPQAKILRHRVDFLVNDKLAIDVDRHVYSNTKITIIRDRMRNQSLVLDGYQPMTFSGNQILADPDGISQTIIATARQLT